MADGREEREEQEKRRQLEIQEPSANPGNARWQSHFDPIDPPPPDPWEPERGGS